MQLSHKLYAGEERGPKETRLGTLCYQLWNMASKTARDEMRLKNVGSQKWDPSQNTASQLELIQG